MPALHRSRLSSAAAFLFLGSAPAGADDLDALAAAVEAWMASAHADHAALSFTYWNGEGEVPVACAACHSGPGFVDFLGADGSTAGTVDHPAPINAVIGCAACHTSAAHGLDSVTLPSGAVVDGLGPDATCTVCHSGRASGRDIAAATAATDEDTVSAELRFINVHYGIAAAVIEGSDGGAGFHYPGQRYAGRFRHVPGADTCVSCHGAHDTAVEPEGCLTCHRGAATFADIRTRHADFDGDGRNTGGIRTEIDGLHARLGEAIRVYARDVAGTPIGYAEGRFPYFFADTDGDGRISADEAVMENRYASWTPRLLKAAHNYQVVAKDAGGHVHNPVYLIQLMHDSLASLSERIDLDLRALSRP
jgi:hypothetical protein